jgi:hypothetical protein
MTLVGYGSPPGHDHDDNCRHRTYTCVNGHATELYRRNRCATEGCDWKGTKTCSCHKGEKLDEWPDAAEAARPPRSKDGGISFYGTSRATYPKLKGLG